MPADGESLGPIDPHSVFEIVNGAEVWMDDLVGIKDSIAGINANSKDLRSDLRKGGRGKRFPFYSQIRKI